ncbi:MAG TPA: transcription antitermination factor NusB [Deltaproteobacteria bacterium]|nr:transcription antitermination factor NusB [Deltaproteobacteria bacterium]
MAINEAIEIAKRFGSSKFPSFANGVLDKVWSEISVEEGPQ